MGWWPFCRCSGSTGGPMAREADGDEGEKGRGREPNGWQADGERVRVRGRVEAVEWKECRNKQVDGHSAIRSSPNSHVTARPRLGREVPATHPERTHLPSTWGSSFCPSRASSTPSPLAQLPSPSECCLLINERRTLGPQHQAKWQWSLDHRPGAPPGSRRKRKRQRRISRSVLRAPQSSIVSLMRVNSTDAPLSFKERSSKK